MEKENVNSPARCIVIGGSAGSLELLFKFLPEMNIPGDTCVVLVLHRKNTSHSNLAELLQDKTNYPVLEIEDKEALTTGVLYICPADYHLLMENDFTFSLDFSERIDFNRPSIDLCFQQIAHVFKENAIAILLSGANADGREGCLEIQKFGGITIAQDPQEAKVPYMPQQAIDAGAIGDVMNLERMIAYLNNL